MKKALLISLLVTMAASALLISVIAGLQFNLTKAETPTPTPPAPPPTPSNASSTPTQTTTPPPPPTPTPTPAPTPSFSPTIPEFTVKFIDSSYATPATYSIDPYTGQNVTHNGFYVVNKTIEVTIKNQQFDKAFSLYYNIRVKEHSAENWTNRYPTEDLPT